MANTVVPEIAQGNAQFNIAQPDPDVTKDILSDGLAMTLTQMGVINTRANKLKGDKAIFYNLNRINSGGKSYTEDSYSNTIKMEYGYREVAMGHLKEVIVTSKDNTLDAVRASTSIGSLSRDVSEQMVAWGKNVFRSIIMNQLGVNKATSFLIPELKDTAFSSTTEINNVIGFNAVPSMHSDYISYAGVPASNPANPSAITSANRASLVDFMIKENVLMSTQPGRTRFQRLDVSKTGFMFLHLVPQSCWNDMMIYAPTADGFPNVTKEMYQRIAATGTNKSKLENYVDGAYAMYSSVFTPHSRYLVLPDEFFPRAVHSNSTVANTRVIITVGKGALDLKVGNAFTGQGGTPMFAVRRDNQHQTLNNYDYHQIEMMLGAKRALVEGFGDYAGTSYELATSITYAYTSR